MYYQTRSAFQSRFLPKFMDQIIPESLYLQDLEGKTEKARKNKKLMANSKTLTLYSPFFPSIITIEKTPKPQLKVFTEQQMMSAICFCHGAMFMHFVQTLKSKLNLRS